MEKSKLYTATGDAGTTSLVGGTRIRKNSIRLEAYGTVDEFSSFLGIVLSSPECPEEYRLQLQSIQNMMFNFGGYLASPVAEGESPKAWGLEEEHIHTIEGWIDSLDAETPKVNSFVLPGGCMAAAHAHVARSVCRRAERRILALAEQEYVDPQLLIYFNRLSDYLFILARRLNHLNGIPEIMWQKP